MKCQCCKEDVHFDAGEMCDCCQGFICKPCLHILRTPPKYEAIYALCKRCAFVISDDEVLDSIEARDCCINRTVKSAERMRKAAEALAMRSGYDVQQTVMNWRISAGRDNTDRGVYLDFKSEPDFAEFITWIPDDEEYINAMIKTMENKGSNYFTKDYGCFHKCLEWWQSDNNYVAFYDHDLVHGAILNEASITNFIDALKEVI